MPLLIDDVSLYHNISQRTILYFTIFLWRRTISPSYNHSYLAYRLAKAVDIDDRYNIHIELTITIDEVDYVPDVALYPRQAINFLDDEIKTTKMPLMAVEILSPTQSLSELTDKGCVYLNHDIRSFWLVIPPAKTVIVYHDMQQPFSFSKENIVDSKLSLEIPIINIFR